MRKEQKGNRKITQERENMKTNCVSDEERDYVYKFIDVRK